MRNEDEFKKRFVQSRQPEPSGNIGGVVSNIKRGSVGQAPSIDESLSGGGQPQPTRPKQTDVVTSPVKQSNVDKLSPLQSRMMSTASILKSNQLTVDEKRQRLQNLTGERLESKTKQEIRDYGRKPQIDYGYIYSGIQTSKQNISDAIINLRNPDTYYDPLGNVIVYDPAKAHQPELFLITTQKIKDLEQQQLLLDESVITVKKAEHYKYAILPTGEGGFEFKPTEESKKIIEKEIVSKKKEELRDFYTGSSEERVAGLGHWVTTGMLSFEDPLGIKSTIQTATGDIEGALETKARATIDLDRAVDEGLGSYVLKVSTGPLATVGLVFAGGGFLKAGTKFASGYLTAKGVLAGESIIKGVQTVAGVGMAGLMVKDVVDTYEKEGMVDAATKGIFYSMLIYAGKKGYDSVKGDYWFSKGQNRYFSKHPNAPTIDIGVRGTKVGAKTKIDISETRGSPTEQTDISIKEITKYKPSMKPKKPSLGESWNPDKQLKYYESLRQGAWKKEMYIRFPGSEDQFFGSNLKGGGVYAGKGRGFRFWDTGKTTKLVADGKTTEIGLAESKQLGHGRKVEFFKWRTPEINSKIYTIKKLAYQELKDLTSKELGGGGGIRQQLEPQILLDNVFPTSVGDVPVFTNVGGGVGGTFVPPVLVPPTNVTDFDLKKDTIKGPDDRIRFKRTPDTDIEPVFDVIMDEDLNFKQGQKKKIDYAFSPPPIETRGIVETVFDVMPNNTKPVDEDIYFKKNLGGIVLPTLPRGLGSGGGTDMGFGFKTPITRHRKHKLGDILGELERGFNF